ncbi:MAG: hypothetical protein ACK50N_02730 [Flavobacteriales bacterium]|jgi:hypothetical protein
MKTNTITYSKTFSLGNYENEKIGVEIQLQEGDNVQKAIQDARAFVEYNHKLNGFTSELQENEHILNNPDDFTGTQLKRAKERIEQLHSAIKKGQQILIGE